MADSILEIKNAAALKLKEPAITTSDTGVLATALNAHYDRVRKLVLAAHRWNFAVTRYTTVSQDNPWSDSGYRYLHSIPDDVIHIFAVYPKGTRRSVESTYIFSDESELAIKYVRDEDDFTLFPVLFAESLAFRLAAECTLFISNLRVDYADMMAGYMAQVSEAKGRNMIESPDEDEEDPYLEWEKARRHGPIY